MTQTVPRIYSRSTSSLGAMSTTWSSCSSIFTYSDVIASGISRANTTFTVPTAGVYYVSGSINYVKNNVGHYVGLRMRRTNGTASTLVHNASWSGANAGGQAMMHGIMQISANDTVDFQCVRGDSNTHGWGTTTLDGEATVTSSITISKIQ